MKKLRTINPAKYLFALWLVLSASVQVTLAQNNSTESPYTRFGLGMRHETTSTATRALGGAALGLRRADVINSKNPASYAAVDSQTFIFDFGASMGVSILKEGNTRDARMLGNFEYATMLFPITRWMAISAGLKPYTSTGYRFGSTEALPGAKDREYTVQHKGMGNMSNLYLGMGFEPFKGFTLGANFSYIFGKQVYVRTIDYGTSGSYTPNFYEMLSARGFRTDVGLQYGFKAGRQGNITLGATYSPSLPLWSKQVFLDNVSQGTGIITTERNDTITSQEAFRMPHEIGLGIAYSYKDKLLLLGDLQYNLWHNTISDTSKATPVNQFRFALGACFVPNRESRSLGQRMEYRFGISGENHYMQIPDATGTLRGSLIGTLSAGIGIPMVDRRSWIDLTLEYKHLMPQAKGMISENYLQLSFGLRFNEAWFRKLKLD